MSIKDLRVFFSNLKLNKTQAEISTLLIKEIESRLEFFHFLMYIQN